MGDVKMADEKMSDGEYKENITAMKKRLAEMEQNMGSASIRQQLTDAHVKLQAKIQEKPILSVGVAFASGLMMGVIGGALIKNKGR
ncbi:hypothetical protein COT47_01975 [Candidatus Woesearchaeota archaeon CG08_land_8_20_14_0_20_43_7]|nr:MAG: hypothetical protein COT47_01975 [Candidatus Woesearchaeota archaeon CG08_land_8_20_14_0_20_43_7]